MIKVLLYTTTVLHTCIYLVSTTSCKELSTPDAVKVDQASFTASGISEMKQWNGILEWNKFVIL